MAATLPDDTPHREKADRIARLIAIQDEIVDKLTQKMLGTTVKVLVEGPGRKEGVFLSLIHIFLTSTKAIMLFILMMCLR